MICPTCEDGIVEVWEDRYCVATETHSTPGRRERCPDCKGSGERPCVQCGEPATRVDGQTAYCDACYGRAVEE
jgi:hypothetical protein